VVESAHDADAGDPDLRVFRHDDLAAAHDRHNVDGDLALGETGVAHVDFAAAHEHERGEFLRHDPVALAGKAAHDGHRSVRGRLGAEPGRVVRGGRGGSRRVRGPAVGQVVGDRLKLGVGLGGVHGVQPLVEFVHGEPPVARGLAQHVGNAFPVGVGCAHIAWFRNGWRATHISQA
jgi:hypothetical protein